MDYDLTVETTRDDFTINAEAAMLEQLGEHRGGEDHAALICSIEAVSALFGRGMWWEDSGREENTVRCIFSGDDSHINISLERIT